jgi:hypothetical protein
MLGALLAVGLTPAAHAGDELYLRWDNCVADGGTHNRTFACDTNSGAQILVGSFRLEQPLTQVGNISAFVDVTARDAPIQPWWQFETGGCRNGSLEVSFAPFVPPTACHDLWSGRTAIGGVSYPTQSLGGRRIHITVATIAGEEFPVPAGQEFVAFQLRINHARTTGQGSCGGCSAPVCLAWSQATIPQYPPAQHLNIFGASTPDNGSNVTWQPGAVATTYRQCLTTCVTGVTCLSTTPTQNRTWGAIKTLYR